MDQTRNNGKSDCKRSDSSAGESGREHVRPAREPHDIPEQKGSTSVAGDAKKRRPEAAREL